MKKNKWWIVIILISLFFITFPMIMTYDSSHYMGYVEILERKAPFATWDIVRGPTFPVLIFLSNFFFGKTAFGLVLFSLVFYLIAFFASIWILQVFKYKKKIMEYITYALFVLLFVLNIIIFGYFHTLLTEFIAISLSILSCYLSWLLLKTSSRVGKKVYILLAIYFILMAPFSWFLKQPYISFSLFPLLFSTIINFFRLKSLKSFLPYFSVFIFSVLSLFISIKVWNGILEYKGIATDGSRSVSSMLGQLLINPLENFEIIEESNNQEYVEKAQFLSGKELEFIKNRSDNFRIVEIYGKNGELVEQMVVETDSNGVASTKNSLKFLLQVLFVRPSALFDSYVTNYLGLINIYQPSTANSRDYNIEKSFQFLGCQENCAIASVIGQTRNNIYYIPDNLFFRVADYEQNLNTPPIFRFFLNKLKPLSILSFNMSFLLLPFVLVIAFIYTIIMRKRMTKSSKESMYLVLILLGYSFLHIMIHVVTSAVIDRYISPAYTTTIVGHIGFLSVVTQSFCGNKVKKSVENA